MATDLNIPLSTVDLSTLSRPLRRKLQRLAKKGLTLRDALTTGAVPLHLATTLAETSHSTGHTSSSPARPTLSIHSTMKDVDKWAEAYRHTELIHIPIVALLEDYYFHHYFKDISIREFFRATTKKRRLWDHISSLLLPQIEVFEQISRRADEDLPGLNEEFQQTPPKPLQALWRQLLDEWTSITATQVPVYAWSDTSVQTNLQDLTISSFETSISFDPSLQISYDTSVSIRRLLSIPSVLRFLTTPSEDRDKLAKLLSVPKWQRNLIRFADAVQPPDVEPSDKPFLGWRVDLSWRLNVRTVRCRPTRTGTFATKLQPDVPRAICTEPGDLLALELIDYNLPKLVTIEKLVGHPRIFLNKDRRPIPLRRGNLSLSLQPNRKGVVLHLFLDQTQIQYPSFQPIHEIEDPLSYFEAETELLLDTFDGFLRITSITDAQQELLEKIHPFLGVGFPNKAVPEVLALLPALSQQIEVRTDPALRGTPARIDPRPLIRLSWDQEQLTLAIRTQPVPEFPPEIPGEGAEQLFVHREQGAAHVQRTLQEEVQTATTLAESLGLPPPPANFTWSLSTRDEALSAVHAIQAQAGEVRVAWTGPRVSISGKASTTNLSLKIKKKRDWFGVEGGVELNGKTVSLRLLMAAALEGHAYVEVSKGNWMAIDETLRTGLAATAAVAGGGTKDTRLSPLHAPLLTALEEAGAALDTPPDWRSLADRARASVTQDYPVPTELNAELRPYQVVGYEWLAALASWAPGACLADDMGLGKTVQTLALLLQYADRGPSMVVAPTSVCFNWQREAERFAPSLRFKEYRGKGREELLTDLAPGDVLLCSYGILTRDAEPLSKVEFNITVLDEAQAIKNASAARSKAACGLQTEFALALSGTPVENHTGELYSLMRFVAPGYLGTPTSFRERFVNPIEGRGDTQRRALLAQLIAPFMLRRTKKVVASDLPDREEHVYSIIPSDAEVALYTKHRLESLVRLQALSANKQRFQVLTELQKLRQLACHPKMLDPGSPVTSSKLKAVRRILADLREAGHRALVFSSFTKHLALVREALEEDGFQICYLDGSTPVPQRLQEVDRFQDGHGDVFLISLKAGGTGLNLTAASYVIHLDPWWNPAAEDQATDRAHRIGQDKKVTVYRMVTKGSIEEQIVALHGSKRELAEALLSGAGEASRVTTDDLLSLLQEVEALPAGA